MASDGSGSIVGALVFVGIVGGLSFLNYNGAGRELKSACMSGNLPDSISISQRDEVCECVKDEGLSEFSPLAYLPLVGRIFAPDESEGYNIGVRSMAICMSRETGIDIPGSVIDDMLRETEGD